MDRLFRSLGGIAVIALVAVLLLNAGGLVSLRLPFDVDVKEETREVAVAPDAPAEVIRIEPITLDCRARIHATVPVRGKKEHRLAGQVYRTDTLSMHAIGDIDTCVDATAVEIVHRADGTSRVLVPADAIEFVRPRVDADAMLGSVDYDKGLVGKLTDAFPWVDDGEGLTAAGYAFAQNMVGSSACMEAAYEATTAALTEAYRQQAVAIGQDPSGVVVDIVGEPRFDQQPPSRLDAFDFDVDGTAECSLAVSAADPM